MWYIRGAYVVSLIGLTLIACSNQAVPTVTAARNAMSGMNAEQITGCMGQPGTVLTQDNTTVWSYNTLNGAAAGPLQSGSFAAAVASPPRAACTVTIIFNQGQVDGVNFLGPNGGQLSQSEGCDQLVQQCTHVARTGVHTP